MAMTIRKLHPGFAAEIAGVDLLCALNDQTFDAIHAAFNEFTALVWHDPPFDDGTQVEFRQRFEPLQVVSQHRAGGGGKLVADIFDVNRTSNEILPVDGDGPSVPGEIRS